MDDNKVRYGRGLKESYLAITEKEDNKLYFCIDTGELFLGETQLSSMEQLNALRDRLSDVVGYVGDMDDLEVSASSLVEAINKLMLSSGSDYATMDNKPSINGIVLEGDLSLDDLGISGSGGSSADDITVSNDIGRYHAGDVIPAGTGLESIFKGILQKKSLPTITAPKATVSMSVPSLAKVGTSVNFGTVTVSFSRGSIVPAYGTDGYRAGAATKYAVKVENGSTELYAQEGASGSFNVGNISITGKGTVSVTGSVTHEAGQQPKDSDGDDYDSALAAGTVSEKKNAVEFILPFLRGGTDGASFTGLTEDLTKKGAKTYSVTTENNRVTFLYDSAYGNLKSIKDENDFENIDGFTKSTVTIDGWQYIAYVSQYNTTGTATYKLSF